MPDDEIEESTKEKPRTEVNQVSIGQSGDTLLYANAKVLRVQHPTPPVMARVSP